MQAYLNRPNISAIDDTGYVIAQLDEAIDAEKDHVLRFGTGELSDSLAMDRRLKLNRPIIEYFGTKKKAILELKSKWASIDHLSDCLNPYTVISFSVSPQRFIDREERRTSPLYKRLRTAVKAQNKGLFVGLHFDPIVIYDGFEKDYQYLIDDIGRMLDPGRIIWISLGLLRFPPKLFDRFLEQGRANLLSGEFIRGEDGKYRYIKNERIRVYRMLYDGLKSVHRDLFLYFCMERSDIWREVTGMDIINNEGLIKLFDRRVRDLYGDRI